MSDLQGVLLDVREALVETNKLLEALIKDSPTGVRAVTYCDNQAAINKLDKFMDAVPDLEEHLKHTECFEDIGVDKWSGAFYQSCKLLHSAVTKEDANEGDMG